MPKPKNIFVVRQTSSGMYRRPSGPLWEPAADVYRTPQGWKIKLDLAGVKPDDVEVVALDDRLIVRGVRRDSFITKDWSYHQLEITYSRFERVLTIPCPIAEARLRIECVDGWLVIHLDYDSQEC